MSRIFLLTLSLATLTCAAQPRPEIHYDPADFTAHSIKQEPKLTAKENGTDIPLSVGPQRTVILLQRGPAEAGRIDIIPLQDPSVPNFVKAYPQVHAAAAALRNLKPKPDPKRLNTADLYCIDGEHALIAKLESLDAPTLSGFAFLTQYTQEQLANPANSEELMYVFLGLTKDRRHYIAAHIPVTHPALPPNIGAIAATLRDPARAYVRRNEKELSNFADSTFRPPLDHLKTLIYSIN